MKIQCNHIESRAGDVRHPRADISKAERMLGFKPTIGFEEGMAKTAAHLKAIHESRQAATG